MFGSAHFDSSFSPSCISGYILDIVARKPLRMVAVVVCGCERDLGRASV